MTFTPPLLTDPTAPIEGPCLPWTTLSDTRARCGLTATDVDDNALTVGIELASRRLWRSTGMRYGLCLRTVMHGPECCRPCAAGRSNPSGHEWCSTDDLPLPGPVAKIESVTYFGETVDPADMRLITHGRAARRSVTITRRPTVADYTNGCPVWEVTYWQGRPIPLTGQVAAQQLAEHYARVVCPDGTCSDDRLANLTRVTRRGVVKEYEPHADTETTAPTNVGLVDEWVATVNPHGLTRPVAVVRPDDPARARQWSWIDVT